MEGMIFTAIYNIRMKCQGANGNKFESV